jgi:hypothetical protein
MDNNRNGYTCSIDGSKFSSERGVGAREALGAGLWILISRDGFAYDIFGFLLGSWALRFPARFFNTPTLAPADGSVADSPLGYRAKTGIAGKGMSPSNPWMEEIKLSKACIQTYKYKISRRNHN